MVKRSTTRRVARRWPWFSGGGALGLAVAIGLLVVLRESPLQLDAVWMEKVIEHRGPHWDVPAHLMDRVGGALGVGGMIIALGSALLLARRRWAALFTVGAAALNVVVVQLLKNLFARARPEDILVMVDFGSFPSGHVANAATVATIFVLVFGLRRERWWLWILGAAWIVAMALSRTYLGAHWVTDTLGGVLVGAAVAVIVWGPFAERIEAEARAVARESPE